MVDLVVHPANHWLWYLAQISLGGSFIAPSLLALRGLLATGFLFLLIWSVDILAVSVDSAVFAGVYCLINLAQLGRLLWARRHVSFDADREFVYDTYFGAKRQGSRKWQCSRVIWNELNVGSRIATLRKGEAIARAGDRCTTLTFLLSGQISYQHANRSIGGGEPAPMHSSKGAASVVDAVEYVHRDTARGAVWGIDAIAATEDVRVLILSYDQIDKVSKDDMAIEPVINGICAVQVTTMLFAVEDGRLHDLMTSPKSPVESDALAGVKAATLIDVKATAAVGNGDVELTRFHIADQF